MVSFEVEMLRVYEMAPVIGSVVFSLRDSTIYLFPHHHYCSRGRRAAPPPPSPFIVRRLLPGCACTVRHRLQDPVRLFIADSPRELADKVLKFVQPEFESEECVMG